MTTKLYHANISCDHATADARPIITSISYNADGEMLSAGEVRDLFNNIGVYVYITNVYLMPDDFIDILCEYVSCVHALYFDDFLQTQTHKTLAKCKKIALATPCKRIGFSSTAMVMTDYTLDQTNTIAEIITEHKTIESLAICAAHSDNLDTIIEALQKTNRITEIFSKFYSIQLLDLLEKYKSLKTLRIDTRFSVGMFSKQVKQLISEYKGLGAMSVYYNSFINAARIIEYTDILRANKSISSCSIWGLSHAPGLAAEYTNIVATIPNITDVTLDIYDLDATVAIMKSQTLTTFEIDDLDQIPDSDGATILRALSDNYTIIHSGWLQSRIVAAADIFERNQALQPHVVARTIFNMHVIIARDMNPTTIVEIYDAISPHHKFVAFRTKYAIAEKLTASYRKIYNQRDVKKAARKHKEQQNID